MLNPNYRRVFGKLFSLLVVSLVSAGLVLAMDSLDSASASGVISVCNESNLANAVSTGGSYTFACDGTIILTNRLASTMSDTTLDATGHNVIINGNDKWNGFTVNSGITLTLKHLTFTHHYRFLSGGVITNSGTLNIFDCNFINNVIAGGDISGAVILNGSVANISNSTFINNSVVVSPSGSAVDAGAIANDGTLNVTNSTFTHNVVQTSTYPDGGLTYTGGAISNWKFATITDSTFSDNSAKNGGAIYSNAFNGSLKLTNNTFTGNSGIYGGVIMMVAGTLDAVNNTFSGNTGVTGANIYHVGNNNDLTLKNTIVANDFIGADCVGTITDGGNNLQYPDTSCGATIPSADPLLGALANNGGPTQTMAISPGSPAIDAGSNTVCAAVPANNLDQRGVTRPVDGDGNGSAICDIGAFEAPANQANLPVVSSLSPSPVTAVGPAFTLTVNGINFNPNSKVRWNGSDRPTTFVSSTQLTAQISAEDIGNGGYVGVSVFNSGPYGGVSNAKILTINNPVPSITGFNPPILTLNANFFTLEVEGSNFVNNSTVRWNGVDVPTVFVNHNRLLAEIDDYVFSGPVNVSVFNPLPGGGSTTAPINLSPTCLPLIVSVGNDVANTCGTLRNALAVAATNPPTDRTIYFSSHVLPIPWAIVLNSSVTIPDGVTLHGVCTPSGPGVVIKGLGSGDGLILGSNGIISGLKISGFNRQIVATGVSSNHLTCVAVSKT